MNNYKQKIVPEERIISELLNQPDKAIQKEQPKVSLNENGNIGLWIRNLSQQSTLVQSAAALESQPISKSQTGVSPPLENKLLGNPINPQNFLKVPEFQPSPLEIQQDLPQSHYNQRLSMMLPKTDDNFTNEETQQQNLTSKRKIYSSNDATMALINFKDSSKIQDKAQMETLQYLSNVINQQRRKTEYQQTFLMNNSPFGKPTITKQQNFDINQVSEEQKGRKKSVRFTENIDTKHESAGNLSPYKRAPFAVSSAFGPLSEIKRMGSFGPVMNESIQSNDVTQGQHEEMKESDGAASRFKNSFNSVGAQSFVNKPRLSNLRLNQSRIESIQKEMENQTSDDRSQATSSSEEENLPYPYNALPEQNWVELKQQLKKVNALLSEADKEKNNLKSLKHSVPLHSKIFAARLLSLNKQKQPSDKSSQSNLSSDNQIRSSRSSSKHLAEQALEELDNIEEQLKKKRSSKLRSRLVTINYHMEKAQQSREKDSFKFQQLKDGKTENEKINKLF